MDDEEFRDYWEAEANEWESSKNVAALKTEDQYETIFKSHRLHSIATGEDDECVRLYLYAKHENEKLHFEIYIDKAKKVLTITIKSTNNNLSGLIGQELLGKFN